MNTLDIDAFENSVPEWFVDWVKIWFEKQLPVNKRVEQLLWENNLEAALEIFDTTLHRDTVIQSPTHSWNNRIH